MLHFTIYCRKTKQDQHLTVLVALNVKADLQPRFLIFGQGFEPPSCFLLLTVCVPFPNSKPPAVVKQQIALGIARRQPQAFLPEADVRWDLKCHHSWRAKVCPDLENEPPPRVRTNWQQRQP